MSEEAVTMTTSNDVTRWVTEALSDSIAEFDADAIVASVIYSYGPVPSADVPAEEFWAIVAEHPATPAPSPAALFNAAMAAAIVAAELGQPAVVEQDDITVEVMGASRVNHTWPQPTATITITAPGIPPRTIHGADLAGPDALWLAVEDAMGDSGMTTAAMLATATRHHRAAESYRAQADQALQLRNQAVKAAIAAGVSKYAIAKTLGVAESTIGRIR